MSSSRITRLVLCSKTEMGENRICSNAIDTDGTQYRIQFPSPTVLSDQTLARIGIDIDKDWVIRRIIQLAFIRQRTHERRTHPEDSLVSRSSIKIEGMLPEHKFKAIITNILCHNPEEIFGTPFKRANGRPVIGPRTTTAASVGYVKTQKVRFYINRWNKMRAYILCESGTELDDIPIKCVETLGRLQNETLELRKTYKNIFAVRLGLSNPYKPPSEHYQQEWCFLQFTGIIFNKEPKKFTQLTLF